MSTERLATLALGLSLIVCGCEREGGPQTAKHAREVMGTFAEVTAVAADQATTRKAVDAAYAQLDRVNELMSGYRDDSEVSVLNRAPAGEAVTVSAETFEVLEAAGAYAELSGGAFDVTCRPLTGVWRAAAKETRLPTEAELQAVAAIIGPGKLELDPANRTVRKTLDAVQVDLGAIAKGYALDLAARAMREAGATAGLVDVGGDVYAYGRRADGEPWRIGIRHPFQEGLFGKLELTDQAAATSGLQQRFFEIDGRRYSHIVDPRTGRPVEQAPSVTVIADTGMAADAWATILSILSVEEGQVLVGQHSGIEALWVWGAKGNAQSAETPGFTTHRTK